MRRCFLCLAVLVLPLLGLATGAAAVVHVQVAITPESIPQCGTGQFQFAILNDGAEPVLARLCLSLARNDVPICKPVCGKLPLAPGESRIGQLDFWLPPIVPPGTYALGVEIKGSDGSSDQSTATLTVTPTVPADCHFPGPDPSVTGLLGSLLLATGAQPEAPTPATAATWGSVKAIYR